MSDVYFQPTEVAKNTNGKAVIAGRWACQLASPSSTQGDQSGNMSAAEEQSENKPTRSSRSHLSQARAKSAFWDPDSKRDHRVPGIILERSGGTDGLPLFLGRPTRKDHNDPFEDHTFSDDKWDKEYIKDLVIIYSKHGGHLLKTLDDGSQQTVRYGIFQKTSNPVHAGGNTHVTGDWTWENVSPEHTDPQQGAGQSETAA